MAPDITEYPAYQSSRPYARWWWLAGPFQADDIASQLDWLSENGFGGVEIAWVDPVWYGRPVADTRPEWLSAEWSSLIGFAKGYADQLGLGCDFTFGSSWPFGGSVVRPADAAQTLTGPSGQRLTRSWEPGPQPVLDHLSSSAVQRYANAIGPSFALGLDGTPSALFCDSLELDAAEIWTPSLSDAFEARYGYRLDDHLDLARTHPHMRYDYRRMVGSTMLDAFFETFAQACRDLGAISRVQCHGAPTDLLAAYAAVDVPESEGLLFEPTFSRIPASAAALAGKPLVSAEAFTCIYGTIGPGQLQAAKYWRREQLADLKLLADALIANGVNQLVWHGMPFNGHGGSNEFYASVHVGPDSVFSRQLPAFNEYLESVCGMMRRGRPYTNLAVYLPNEDMLMRDRIPDEQRTPGAVFEWEMRRVAPPAETEGHHPTWVSEPFLRQAQIVDGQISIGDVRFAGLYADVEWMDAGALEHVARLARGGAKIVLKRAPSSPGMRRNPQYAHWLAELSRLPNVSPDLSALGIQPLVEGQDVPPYWAKQGTGELLIFFAHPFARDVHYPMRFGQSHCTERLTREVVIRYGSSARPVTLTFEPYQSVLLRVPLVGEVSTLDLEYTPEPAFPDPGP
ncbi:MAG: glycosyl hydrolase [Chloroflexota bacterium]